MKTQKTINVECIICKTVFKSINRGPQLRTCSKVCRRILRHQQNQNTMKLGQYVLDKDNFILYDLHNKKIDNKRHFEYICENENCKSIFITKAHDQKVKEFKWICRACVTKQAWKKDQYKKNHIEGDIKGWTAERREIGRDKFNKLWATPSFRKKVLEILRDEEIKKKSMHFSHISRRIRYSVSDNILRSTYEYRFAKVLNKNNIKWEYELKRFKIFYSDEKNKHYYPDFYLPEYDLWIEIKGYWFDTQKVKFQKFLEQYPNIKIKVFYEKQIKMVEEGDLSEIIK